MANERSYELISNAYSKRLPGQVKQIDPAILSEILEMAFSLIKSCLGGGNDVATIKEVAKNRPIIARMRILQAMRQSGQISRANRNAVVDSLLECCDQATEQEITNFVQENDFYV